MTLYMSKEKTCRDFLQVFLDLMKNPSETANVEKYVSESYRLLDASLFSNMSAIERKRVIALTNITANARQLLAIYKEYRDSLPLYTMILISASIISTVAVADERYASLKTHASDILSIINGYLEVNQNDFVDIPNIDKFRIVMASTFN